MAPIEFEFGRRAKVQDIEIFIHDESVDQVVVQRGKKSSRRFYAREAGRELVMKLEVECPAEDNGGIIKYRVDELKILRPREFLDEETLVITDSGCVSRTVRHPYVDSLEVGFRAKHVKSEPEIK